MMLLHKYRLIAFKPWTFFCPIKTLQQNKTNEKFWYLLLAALAAVSVGLQVAVIFVLAFRER